MDRKFLELFRQFMKEQKKRKIWKKAVSVLAGFVVFFTTYALILPAITMESTIVCGIENHEHTKDCYGTDLNAPASTLSGNTLSGNTISGNEVNEDSVVEEKSESVEAVPYIYEDDELAVTVTLPDGSSVPEGAVLRVRPIMDTDEEYEDLAQQAEEAVDGQAQEIVLYDISFYTEENEYIPVSEEAVVSFQFKETVLAETSGEVTVLHYEEGTETPTQLAEVEIKTDKNDAVEKVTFQTEGFSVFAMVKIVPQKYVQYNVTDINALDGKEFVIVCSYNQYSMMADIWKTDDGEKYLSKQLAENVNYLSSHNHWTFEKVAGTSSNYYLRSGTKYLVMNQNQFAFVEGLTIGATQFEVSLGEAGRIFIKNSQSNYYINRIGTNGNYFGGWMDDDNGSELYLYQEAAEEQSVDYVTNLAGKSYAIINYGSGDTSAVLNEEKNDETYGKTLLKAQAVSLMASTNGLYYFNSDSNVDVTMWTFEKVSDEKSEQGIYYIYALDNDGNKQYLNIDNSNISGNNSITLSTNPQELIVTGAESTGKVSITNGDKVALNLFAGSVSYGFGGWPTLDYNFVLCEKADGESLIYNLNFNYVYNDSGWLTAGKPYIENAMQTITNTGTLQSVLGNVNENGYFWNCYSVYENYNIYHAVYGGEDAGNVNGLLKDKGYSYGKEFRFDGWQATVEEQTYLFPENAFVTATDEGFMITDVNGVERTIPIGTVLNGKWSQISDIALFYVNFKGTVLDTEGDVSGRDFQEFTPCVGIAHIYNGTQSVGRDKYFATEVNEIISDMFRAEYDPDDPSTQIVMEFVREKDSTGGFAFNKAAPGIAQNTFEEYVLKYIRESNQTIQISTDNPNNNPMIDSANADTDHYDIRWYVTKDQVDGWHIDGVLVAKVEPMKIIKTISGLSDEQAAKVMGLDVSDGTSDTPTGLNINVKLGPNRGDYITVYSKKTVDGQYTYDGQLLSSVHSYSWTFQAIKDELYTMTENSYDYSDDTGNYDCSTAVVVRTKDGKYHELYDTDTTKGIVSGQEDKYSDGYLKGGVAESVSFNNFYTLEGTGLLNITKRDSTVVDLNDATGKLGGAVFELINKKTNNKVTVTTNSNGSATFNNLELGSYILVEKEAPEGFNIVEEPWTVQVKENGTDNNKIIIKVTITDSAGNETVCYDGGIKETYIVNNKPNKTLITINKKFENITEAELNTMKTGDGQYKITVENDSTKYTLLLDGTSDAEKNIYVGTPSSTDGMTFSWRLVNVEAGNYTVTEHNFGNVSTKDTIVGSNNQPVDIDYGEQTASITTTIIKDTGNLINITNRYTDEYTLKLLKKNADGTKSLAGAKFAVYSDHFAEATENNSHRISFIDSEGNQKTAYYVGMMTYDKDGIYTYEGLTLSEGEDKYTYVIKEVTAPTGYALLKEPIVIYNVGPDNVNKTGLSGITVSGAIDGGTYYNGVFTVTVPNTPIGDAKVSVTASKKWEGLSDGTGEKVELQLYRKTKNGSLAAVDPSVPMDGTVDSNGETESWKYTWSNLEAYDTDGEEYSYYVYEVPMDGFEASYSNGTEEHTYNGDKLSVGTTIWSLKELAYEVTITNATTYRLPETGGSGALWYTIGGICLMMAAAFLYKRDRMMKGGRGS